MLDVSVFGLLPLLENLTKFTHPKIKRDSLCLDRSWPMLIFSVSSKPMKSRNVISKSSSANNDGTPILYGPYYLVHITWSLLDTDLSESSDPFHEYLVKIVQ